jgi:hypothetical protein
MFSLSATKIFVLERAMIPPNNHSSFEECNISLCSQTIKEICLPIEISDFLLLIRMWQLPSTDHMDILLQKHYTDFKNTQPTDKRMFTSKSYCCRNNNLCRIQMLKEKEQGEKFHQEIGVGSFLTIWLLFEVSSSKNLYTTV